jgi:hypothetical protein
VKDALRAVGESTTHRSWTSLRKTGASRARAAGVDRLALMRAGNWKSDACDTYFIVHNKESSELSDAILQGTECGGEEDEADEDDDERDS